MCFSLDSYSLVADLLIVTLHIHTLKHLREKIPSCYFKEKHPKTSKREFFPFLALADLLC